MVGPVLVLRYPAGSRAALVLAQFWARRTGASKFHVLFITKVEARVHQNVNKVNTKVTLRCPLSSDWIPLWAHDYLKKSVSAAGCPGLPMLMFAKPFYVSSTKCIQITSTVHRSQAQNIDDCLKKVCPIPPLQ